MHDKHIRELRDSFPEKCIITWGVKEDDLVWQRQVRVGEYCRLFHSMCKDHPLGENSALFKNLKKPSIPEQKMRGTWGKLRLEPLTVARLCKILGHRKDLDWG